MREPSSNLDLPQEALGAERCGDLGAEDLDGDGAAVPEIAREVHGGHPAASQLTLDGVAVGQGCAEAIKRRSGHTRPTRLSSVPNRGSSRSCSNINSTFRNTAYPVRSSHAFASSSNARSRSPSAP